MKLILTREVAGVGSAGDVVTVKDGFARNYLLPRGNAIAWSLGGEKQIQSIRRARSAREVRDIDHAKEIKAKLESATVVAKAKVGVKGALFGSVTDKDVATLRKYISDRGKIRARRVTGACTQHQRSIATAVKNSREVALLPYTSTAR